MPITKSHKLFRWVPAMPIDANNIILEQAFARFLVLVRTKGRPYTSTTKDTLYPENLVEIVRGDTTHFEGSNRLSPTPAFFATMACYGIYHVNKGRHGWSGKEPNRKSLSRSHMSTIKAASTLG